ncbi:MAG: NADH-quinone oxidoreductase subunit I [Deltaproteobacteria bacterium]|nr:NADH-quinone oxidoreductase subunit I [Deltaproteobacteria bacterium]
MTFVERLYLPAILQGMLITGWHFVKNIFFMDRRMTIEFPEKKKTLPPGYRAEHRLMLREDGNVRCTACMLCATVCPARCIEIEAEDVGDNKIEKRPKNFTINELRCVFCGLCVEACPCDAIRMDTGKFENATFDRRTAIYDIKKLINNQAEGQSQLSQGLY